MKYQHSFTVSAPIEDVRAFHYSASSLKAITPPIFFMSGIQAPARLSEGDEIAFTLWNGPIPVRWRVRIARSGDWGFEDHQVRGPFERWVHRHYFERADEGQTRIRDEIEYQIKRHWFWGLIGSLMAIGLPLLFWYRARKTKSILAPGGTRSQA